MTYPWEQQITDLCPLEIDSASSPEEMRDEFAEISQVKLRPSTVGRRPENLHKNRYADVVPADFSRVKLQPRPYLDTDYCNGSWIGGSYSARDYIAINGPLESTLVDFYDMVHDNDAKCLVQLTGFVENGVAKCYDYLPRAAAPLCLANGMVVSAVATEANDFSVTTLLKLDYNGATKLIKHHYFTEWRDQKIPSSPENLLKFQRAILNDSEYDSAPKVVHCSAGVGRTGSFITVDYAIRTFLRDGVVPNVSDFVKNLRLSRPYMVQTFEQYRFVHKCVDSFVKRAVKL